MSVFEAQSLSDCSRSVALEGDHRLNLGCTSSYADVSESKIFGAIRRLSTTFFRLRDSEKDLRFFDFDLERDLPCFFKFN